MAPKSSPRALTKKGKLTKHDLKALELIELAETACTHDEVTRAENLATSLGKEEAYRKLFSTFRYKDFHVMHYASRFGKVVLSQLLYSHLGVSADTRDGVGRTALHHAAFSPSAKNTSWVITNFGASLDAKDAMGFTPLHLAIVNDNHGAMEVLLSKGADTESISPLGRVIHLAASKLNTTSFKVLIPKVNVNDVVQGCLNPMVCAIFSGNVANLATLLEEGADVHKCKLISKAIIADLPTTEVMVKLLIEYGALPSEYDEEMFEDIPIISAAKRKNTALVSLLASRCDPIDGVTWNVDGILSYVGSSAFNEHDSVRKAQRVHTLRGRVINGLREGNYLLSKISTLMLKNDLDEIEWVRHRDLCDLFLSLGLEGRKLPLDSNHLYCSAMSYKRTQDPRMMIERLNAALALDPSNTLAQEALRNLEAGTSGRDLNEGNRISRRT